MQKLKFLISLFLGLAVIFGQVGAVNAAPPQQGGAPITGSVDSVVVETNPESGLQTVVVTLLVDGELQTIHLSVETATGLGLFVVDEEGAPVLDENGIPVVDDAILETNVDVDPTTILPEDPVTEENQHPVGAKIAEFFSGLFDVDYELIMSSHSDGFGFGVLTQSLWITEKLGGDATLFQNILDAKKNHDYSLITLPDGSIPQSWGQLRKTVLKGEDDQSLGDIMSHGDDESGNPGNGNNDNTNGKPENPGNGNSKPENPGHGNGKPENPGNGNTVNPGNGNKPENPPGQTKDKTKDNNGNGKTK